MNRTKVCDASMIRKVVIPAAGSGTRLLPATKQQPKEMLPVFGLDSDGKPCLKPFIQVVFEKLHEKGLREFCFVVGRGKRSIEDHFTYDYAYLQRVSTKTKAAEDLRAFGEKIMSAGIIFVNQSEPRGLGDAVRCAQAFTGTENFMVHAGDDLVISENCDHIVRLVRAFRRYNADAVFCVERVDNPRSYGVMTGRKVARNLHHVTGVEEKPSHPRSKFAIVAIYIFRSMIHGLIEKVKPDRNGEIQLTSAIARMIHEGGKVYGVELNRNERRIEIGTPSSYWNALRTTSRPAFSGGKKSNWPL